MSARHYLIVIYAKSTSNISIAKLFNITALGYVRFFNHWAPLNCPVSIALTYSLMQMYETEHVWGPIVFTFDCLLIGKCRTRIESNSVYQCLSRTGFTPAGPIALAIFEASTTMGLRPRMT